MTDAREIIALANHCAADNASAHDMADAALRALHAAGYRILGPDEVDPVTRDRIAEFAKSEFRRDFESSAGWRDQFVTAIRAIGRKA